MSQRSWDPSILKTASTFVLYITAGSQKGSKGGVYFPLHRRHKTQTQITISQQFQQTQYTNPAPEHVNLESKSKMDKT